MTGDATEGSASTSRARDIIAVVLIALVVSLVSAASLKSGSTLNWDGDFFQYAAKYEAARKSLLEYGSFPLRSHWFGGGYPTLGDPENPALNPLLLFPLLFGTVWGLKLVVYLCLLTGGISTYGLARVILGYTRWGALFSGLIVSLSTYFSLRILSGNFNDIYPAFIPLCLLLIGLACRGSRAAILPLPFIFYTMLSDGKMTAVLSLVFIGFFCVIGLIPGLSIFSGGRVVPEGGFRPIKVFAAVLLLTVMLGMVRFLPALELIQEKGGLGSHFLPTHTATYSPSQISAWTFTQLWKLTCGWNNRSNVLTVGWAPVLLFAVSLLAYWRRTVPWLAALVLFAWLSLAYNAPVDLFKLLWQLPFFNTISRPGKYFSFEIVLALALASGQAFQLLARLRKRWQENLLALALIAAAGMNLYTFAAKIQENTYHLEIPAEQLVPEDSFFNVQGRGISHRRIKPLNSVTYINLRRNIGTIDWHTSIPGPRKAAPKYFVNKKGSYLPNPAYRGEAYLLGHPAAEVDYAFRPNTISARVEMEKPGILVFNQNYHRDWRTDTGTLANREGLLAVELDGGGEVSVRLLYVPRSFYIGLSVSTVTLMLILLTAWSFRTGRIENWARSPSRPLRSAARAVLWITS